MRQRCFSPYCKLFPSRLTCSLQRKAENKRKTGLNNINNNLGVVLDKIVCTIDAIQLLHSFNMNGWYISSFLMNKRRLQNYTFFHCFCGFTQMLFSTLLCDSCSRFQLRKQLAHSLQRCCPLLSIRKNAGLRHFYATIQSCKLLPRRSKSSCSSKTFIYVESSKNVFVRIFE